MAGEHKSVRKKMSHKIHKRMEKKLSMELLPGPWFSVSVKQQVSKSREQREGRHRGQLNCEIGMTH